MSAAKELVEKDVAMERWNALLQSIAKGEKLEDACLAAGVTCRELESTVLGSPLESERWRDARLQGKASRWSLLERDEVFERIAAGVEVEGAITDVRGAENVARDVAELFELVAELPEWSERFESAMRAKHLRDSQQILKITDDTSRDTLETLKGPIPNAAAVQRDRLRFEARTWLWARLDPDRWGERKNNVNVQVNIDHVAILEGARTREKLRDKSPARVTQRVIDAAFKPVVEEPAVEEPVAAAQKQSKADALRTAAAQWDEPTAEQPAKGEATETENPWAALEE